MNSLLLHEQRRVKNYSVSSMSGLPWWWWNREWFWWMNVGWKTLCPWIKGPYSQEAKEMLGPVPRSPWSHFTTGWCFLIRGRSLISMKPEVGKKTRNKTLWAEELLDFFQPRQFFAQNLSHGGIEGYVNELEPWNLGQNISKCVYGRMMLEKWALSRG